MPNDYSKDQSSISRLTTSLNANILFVVFFILLVLKVIPGGYGGNRTMGGIVWLLAGGFFVWRIFRCYGAPSKWFQSVGIWISNNRLAAFFWVVLGAGLFISCLNTLPVIKQYGYMGIGHWAQSRKADGFSIKEVYDHQLRKNVVEFSLPSKKSGYIDYIKMPNKAAKKSISSDSLILKWKMNFDGPFIISIFVNTPQGRRVLNYTGAEKDRIVIAGKFYNYYNQEKYFAFYHGLGTDLRNGGWQTIVRDLEADLRKEDLATKIENIIEFRINGKGRIDDIALHEAFGWVWQKQQLPLALLVSALASYIFLFLSYGLFRLYPGNRNYLWAIALLLLVNIIPVWQKFDFDSTRFFMDYTLGGYFNYWIARRITSVLDAVTTYSSLAAVVAVFSGVGF